ncbi:MAG: TIGR04211 family SH3 domain-containing protein [Sedimenticola sp.]|nr:TIGR04211 family SH3 domain-containing protein [Sedimenticola sp.]
MAGGRLRLILALPLLLLLGTAQGARITDKLLAGFYEQPDASGKPLRVLPSDTPLERLENSDGFTRVRLGDGSEGWVETRFISDEKSSRIMLLELQAKNSQLQQQLRQANQKLKALGGTDDDESAEDPELAELKRQLADARAEIELLKQQAATPETGAPESGALKRRLAELEQALAEAQAAAEKDDNEQLANLRQSQQALQARLDRIAALAGAQPAATPEASGGIRLSAWHLPALGLALLLSFIGGIAFKNHRLARRYGGFRL